MTEGAVTLSPLEEERFGIRTAWVRNLKEESFSAVMDFCDQQQARLLVARCSAHDLRLVHKMEQSGFQLMDTLVYYRRNLAGIPAMDEPSGIIVRPVRPGEERAVQSIAGDAFRGYQSHYHSDPRLDPVRCDQVYSSWALHSCTVPGVADQVLVAACDGVLVGFATLRMVTLEEGEGVLFGVAPVARGKGIYRLFMIHSLDWCRQRGAKWMIYSTQVTNFAVQKPLVRLGFEPSAFFYTLHKWFD
jgi:GNAT superfamily N-acetyltransferase